MCDLPQWFDVTLVCKDVEGTNIGNCIMTEFTLCGSCNASEGDLPLQGLVKLISTLVPLLTTTLLLCRLVKYKLALALNYRL